MFVLLRFLKLWRGEFGWTRVKESQEEEGRKEGKEKGKVEMERVTVTMRRQGRQCSAPKDKMETNKREKLHVLDGMVWCGEM